MDEFEQYYSTLLKPNVTNLIKWWLNYCKQFPTLYVLALELHACPKISSECEQIFSDTGRMTSPNYNHFLAVFIEEEESLRKWLRMGVPKA